MGGAAGAVRCVGIGPSHSTQSIHKAGGGPKRRLVGLEMIDRGIGRDGYSVMDLEGREIGVVTSGSLAPFLKTNIALALVTAEAASGQDVLVQCRANHVLAKQVPLPFYKRAKK